MDFEKLTRALQEDSLLYRELIDLVAAEGQTLRGDVEYNAFEYHQARRQLLPKIKGSLDQLKLHRLAWMQIGTQERARHPEIAALLRQNQDLIMKVVVLDRENEQHLLRRGLLPPRAIPSAASQNPNYVAGLYRRGSASA